MGGLRLVLVLQCSNYCLILVLQLYLAEQERESCFLAHRVRISETLPWDRKSFLAHRIRISEIFQG